jgi:hypothetical protein
MDVSQCSSYARGLESLRGLESNPVGVILDDGARPVTNSVIIAGNRSALMRACHGLSPSIARGHRVCNAEVGKIGGING